MSKLNLTPEQATKEIKAVKQSNKVAREKRAKLRGYASSELYLKALQAIVDGKVESPSSSKPAPKAKKASKAGKKPVILVIDVLDRSGSMGWPDRKGDKLYNALQGLNEGVTKLQQEESSLGVEYHHQFITFDSMIKIGTAKPINKVSTLTATSGGVTALNDAIIKSVKEGVSYSKDKECKVLINIYTDGGENASRSSAGTAKEAVKDAESKGIVVTFVGTVEDTNSAIRNYGIHESNTNTYDGTAEGMSLMAGSTQFARAEYSKKVVKGEDVSRGFYKKIVK